MKIKMNVLTRYMSKLAMREDTFSKVESPST